MAAQKIYIYDGSFQGLLTVLYQLFSRKEIPFAIEKESAYRKNLFYTAEYISNNAQQADFFSDKVKEFISSQALTDSFHAFLADETKVELDIFKYFFMGFKLGKKVDNYLTKDYIRKVQELARRVRSENHRLKGLVRFKESIDGKYYAALAPDNDLLILLAPHFKNRFAVQDWVLHDKKRGKAVIYSAREKDWLLIELEADFEPELSQFELEFQNLWQTFFISVSINNRVNPRAQRQFMPKKYWSYLIEDPGSSY